MNLTVCLDNNPFRKMKANEPCPIGTEVTSESRCREAVKWKSSLGLKRWMAVGAWGHVPYQCTVNRKNGNVNFSTNSNKKGFTSADFLMICEAGKNLLLYVSCFNF